MGDTFGKTPGAEFIASGMPGAPSKATGPVEELAAANAGTVAVFVRGVVGGGGSSCWSVVRDYRGDTPCGHTKPLSGGVHLCPSVIYAQADDGATAVCAQCVLDAFNVTRAGGIFGSVGARGAEDVKVAGDRGPDALLGAPCVFCDYSGESYYQAGSHGALCPWHYVGGLDRRRELARGVVSAAWSDLDDARRALIWALGYQVKGWEPFPPSGPPGPRYAFRTELARSRAARRALDALLKPGRDGGMELVER